MTALVRASDIDARILTVHAAYLRADLRGSVTEAAELYAELDALLDARLAIPLPRPPSDSDGHRPPGLAY